MSHATGLDHVGVVGRNLDALGAEFSRLGFCLTPFARHAGGRTGNRCIMLRQGYIELLAVVAGGRSETLDRFLARHDGIHILAMAIDDAAAALQRLHRAGLTEAAITQTDRAVDDADPSGPRARFTLITTPDLPEGRINLICHHTPEALWQQRFLQHPNRAAALTEVVVVADTPAISAAQLSRRAGCPVIPDRAGGYSLDLSAGAVRIISPDAARVFSGASPPALPWIASVTLRTDDSNKALHRLLQDAGMPFHAEEDALLVPAAGAMLRFVTH